jgi:hypothetical protein
MWRNRAGMPTKDSESSEGLAQEAAQAFQLGMEAQGNFQLVRLIDRLAEELGSPLFAPQLPRVEELLKNMFEAQSRGDFLYLADLLSYELIPLLRS